MLNMDSLIERMGLILQENPSLAGEKGRTGLVNASGASKSVVSQWFNGGIKSLNIRYALVIERELGYCHIWLMTGDGSPRKTGPSAEALEVAAKYDRLHTKAKHQVMQQIDSYFPDDAPAAPLPRIGNAR